MGSIFLLGFSVFAQQQPVFTQYYVNDLIINHAVSGSKSYNPLIIQTRQQWLGFEGAPLTSNISYKEVIKSTGNNKKISENTLY